MISDRPFGKIENPDSITAPHVPSSARRGGTLALPERQSPHATGNAPISSHSPPCLSSKIFPFRSCRGQASSSKRNQCRFPGRLAPTTAQAFAPTSRSRNWPARRRTWPRLSAGTRTPWRDVRRKCDDAAANRRPVLPGQARKWLGPAMRRRSGRCVESVSPGLSCPDGIVSNAGTA